MSCTGPGSSLEDVVGSDTATLKLWRSKKVSSNTCVALHRKYWGKNVKEEEARWRNSPVASWWMWTPMISLTAAMSSIRMSAVSEFRKSGSVRIIYAFMTSWRSGWPRILWGVKLPVQSLPGILEYENRFGYIMHCAADLAKRSPSFGILTGRVICS
ncbi:hypothetical protein CPB84DRAFT_787140 [Gymnopilus junonius]|uniref:Uncharacterized protein n=1 Tax=Gymnopilus junonius TaxID=109634 RepID=A0A9P5NSA4_GYMJU|nr:hypothetical protein CPB84DRAFT_787140 [Gymnopilus junonius]